MIIFKKSVHIQNFISDQKKEGKIIGFVPTMGALHDGHLALIQNAIAKDSLVICSIFVNPTQFNNRDDFKNYPNTIEKDIEHLINAGCNALFLPSETEIYPSGYINKYYELGRLEEILEGRYRPGHFQGVCQVVDRLLEIVDPDKLYLGQKDFQQCMVIKRLLQLLNKSSSIDISIIPTLRETDGLAMSSRNLRLNEEQRKIAPAIFGELKNIKNNIKNCNFNELKQLATEHLTLKGFKVDYVEIANTDNLESASDNKHTIIALAAAYLGQIRLIDNLLLN